MDEVAVRTENLYRFFHTETDEVHALRGVSLEVSAGEIAAIVGPSGSGKSTLLHCIGGLDEPDGGRSIIRGEVITRRPERVKADVRARLIGVLFQERSLIDHLTLRQNVIVGLRLAGIHDDRQADAALQAVGIHERATSYPSEVSGGESVRAALAVAWAKRPAVLLADEPTGELDSESEALVLDLVRDLSRKGAASIIATHSERAARVADAIHILEDGRLVD